MRLHNKQDVLRITKLLQLGPNATMEANGVSLSLTELGFVDGVTAGTAVASKAVVLDSSKGISTITSATITTVTTGAIAAADSSLGITGQLQATTVAGGAVVITGAASIAGATGPGGAVSVIGGASGSTNDAGGAVIRTGGAGSGTGAGGAAVTTGGAGGATGVGGAASVTGGAGGATSGVGGDVAVTGGAASANNDNGGNVVVAGGAPHGTGVVGMVRLQAKTVRTQAAPGTMTTTRALTAAEVLGGIMAATHAGGAATINVQCPTGTALKAAMGTVAAGDSIELVIINIGTAAAADTYTLTVNTDVTIVGNPIVQGNHSSILSTNTGRFRFRWTTGTTFVAYRIA